MKNPKAELKAALLELSEQTNPGPEIRAIRALGSLALETKPELPVAAASVAKAKKAATK